MREISHDRDEVGRIGELSQALQRQFWTLEEPKAFSVNNDDWSRLILFEISLPSIAKQHLASIERLRAAQIMLER